MNLDEVAIKVILKAPQESLGIVKPRKGVRSNVRNPAPNRPWVFWGSMDGHLDCLKEVFH